MQDLSIASNTFYQIITKTFTSSVGFVITIILAHFYGAALYGEYTKVTAFIGIFYILIDFGLNAVFLKLEEKPRNFRNLLALRISFSVLLVAFTNLVLLLFPYDQQMSIGFPPGQRFGVFIFSLTIIFQAIIFTSTAVFQKKLNYKPYMISVSAGTLLLLLLTIIFAYLKTPIEFIYLAYLIGNLSTAFISLRLINERIFPIRLDINFSKKIIKTSYPLGLMFFFNLVYFRFDIVILSFFSSSIEVANYGYAFKYFEFLLAIPLFISNSLYPFLLRSLKNLRSYHDFTRKYLLIFLVIALVITIPAWYASPLIALVKNDFLPSVFIFRILLLSLPIFFITGFLQWTLIAGGSRKYLLYAYVLAALFNLLLNIIFIPQYGSIAAAVVTGLSEFIVLLLLFAKYIKTYSAR